MYAGHFRYYVRRANTESTTEIIYNKKKKKVKHVINVYIVNNSLQLALLTFYNQRAHKYLHFPDERSYEGYCPMANIS